MHKLGFKIDHSNIENRAYRADFTTEGSSIEGRAIVFGQRACLYRGDDFAIYEIINREALNEADLSDISLLINHREAQLPLARYREGNGNSTMRIDLRETGLDIRAELDDRNPEAAAVLSALRRGDLGGMSFGFWIENSNRLEEGNDIVYEVTRISRVSEVSIVTHPAYSSTYVSARNLDEVIKELEERTVKSTANNELAGDNTAIENNQLDEERAKLDLAKAKFKFMELIQEVDQ